MATVAVVGLGGMGSRIAARLLAAGHQVVIWNRSAAKAAPLVELGATTAATPAQAARRTEVVLTMVADPPALRAVTEGTDGVAAGVGAASIVIEMSTVGPTAIARLAALLPPGTGLLDAPVLGSLAEAAAGSLTIFVGGATQFVDRAAPLLATLGTAVHVGSLGAGAAAKLVANASVFGVLGTLGEALALARGLGLSAAATWQVLAATPLAAQARRRQEAVERGDYPPRFPLALACKDARLIDQAAAAAAVELRLIKAAGTWLALAEAGGLGGRDYTAMLATILHAAAPGPPVQRTVQRAPIDYDGLIADLDGVVWRGDEPIPGVAEAIAAARASGTRVVFMTNEPGRPRSAVAARLTAMGIPATAAEVVTSAAVAARVIGSLTGLASRRALVVGPAALRGEIEAAGFHLLGPEQARRAAVVVVGGHPGFDYTELSAATAAIRNGARLYATGRDAVFPTPQGPRPGTGAVLAAVETAGGEPAVVVGKPEAAMFAAARETLAGCERVAAVGDHLITDIAGAKRAGLAAILVLTGVTNRSDLQHAMIQPDLVLDSLAALPTTRTRLRP